MQPTVLAAQMIPMLGELTRFVRWLVIGPEDPEEVLQETLTRALKHARALQEPRALRAWLFRIARNVHVDLLRRKAARDHFVVLEGGLDELADLAVPVAPDILDLEPGELEQGLARLSEGARMALVLTDVWEFDHAEVAQILDVPLGTVKSRVARARARLAKILTERGALSTNRRGA